MDAGRGGAAGVLTSLLMDCAVKATPRRRRHVASGEPSHRHGRPCAGHPRLTASHPIDSPAFFSVVRDLPCHDGLADDRHHLRNAPF
jgi:hypothetical protein